MFISAIGEAYRMWPHGNEYAFTLIPNFLVTEILAMTVGFSTIICTVGFVHKKNGPLVFLLLFTLTWAVSTRIDKPLTWWRKVLPQDVRRVLAKLWLWSLVAGALLLVMVLEIAVTGFVPGVNDPDLILTIMLAALGVGLGVLLLTFVAGFAHDTEKQIGVVGFRAHNVPSQ